MTPDFANSALELLRSFGGHWWAPLLFIAAYTPASLVLIPRWPITLAAVAAFGPWAAFAYAEAGVLLAALFSFYAGRLADPRSVAALAGGRVGRIGEVLDRRGLVAVTALRLVPVAPFVVVNAVLGALRIRVRHFVGGTLLGTLPGLLATTILGAEIITALLDFARVNWLAVAAAVATLIAAAAGGRWCLARPGRS